MDRRAFIAIVGSSLLACIRIANAQQARRVWHVGFLAGGVRPPDGAVPAPLREELQALGFAESTDITYEGRWGQGRNERLRELAAELFSRKVDLIVAFGGPAAEAAKQNVLDHSDHRPERGRYGGYRPCCESRTARR